jgi:hypothetical protein
MFVLRHIKNICKIKELGKKSICAKIAHVQSVFRDIFKERNLKKMQYMQILHILLLAVTLINKNN